MDRLQVGNSIRIPTGVDTEQYLSPSLNSSVRSVRSPSILVIASSPSPSKKSRFNNLQEVPKIPTRSRIPVPQKTVVIPANLRRTDVYRQPVIVGADNQISNLYNSTPLAYTMDNGINDISASKNLPILPAIGVNNTEQSNQQRHSIKMPAGQQGSLEHSQMHTKPYYQMTNTKPVFQMRAEYNNMLQNYQKHGGNHQHSPHLGQMNGTHITPCGSCGRHVAQKQPMNNHSHSHTAQHQHYHPHYHYPRHGNAQHNHPNHHSTLPLQQTQAHGNRRQDQIQSYQPVIHYEPKSQAQLQQPEFEQVSRQASAQSSPRLPSAGNYTDEHYVQQWLVNPSHPYQIPAQNQAQQPTQHPVQQPAQQPAQQPTQQPTQQLTQQPTQQQPQQAPHQPQLASSNIPIQPAAPHPQPMQSAGLPEQSQQLNPMLTAKPTVQTTANHQSHSHSGHHRKQQAKVPEVPIRYTLAPTHQVISKSSGKLLSPEDALKRTLKHKKIPPLTKRNSLRSIFSDASSNLQKIAEELEEEHQGESIEYTDKENELPGTSHTSNRKQSLSDMNKMSMSSRQSFRKSSPSRTNYALLCRLIINGGSQALHVVFCKIYPPLTLSENLAKPQVQKTLRRLKNQEILTTEYWELLYPTKKKTRVKSDQFGFTLLLILLKSACHLSPPYPNGWSELPLASDRALSADLARLTWYTCHLATLTSLSEDEFSSMWGQLCEIFTRLAAESANVAVKRIHKDIMDHSTQDSYIQAISKGYQLLRNASDREKYLKSKSSPRRGSLKTVRVDSSMTEKSGTFVITSNKSQTSGGAKALKPSASGTNVSPTKSHYNQGMAQGDRNALLSCYKLIVDTVQPEECVNYLVSQKILSKEDKSNILSTTRTPRDKMKDLLEILPNRTSDTYKQFLRTLERNHPDVVQALNATRSSLNKNQSLKSLDIRLYMKDYLRRVYADRFQRIRPYFWNSTITADLKSHYVQLDITDLKGLKSNVARSRRFPIERLFLETSRPAKVLLEGKPGSGKSTYCNKLVYDWARGDNFQSFDVVILLDQNRIDESSLEEAIYSQLSLYNGELNMKRDMVWSVLMACKRRLLIILDVFHAGPEDNPKVMSLLRGEILEDCSVLITCLPEQVTKLSPFCDRRLINLGLDRTRQEQFITRYALLNRGKAEDYAGLVSSTLHHMGKEYEYLMSSPRMLSLLCLLTQNEEKTISATTSLLLQSVFNIYPFLYCIQQGVDYNPDNPPADMVYALNQLQSLALETVLDNPQTIMSYEMVQHGYGCKLLTRLGVLETHDHLKDNKLIQVLSFRDRTLQEFLAASKLSQLSTDEVKNYIQRMLSSPSLHRTLVLFVGCKRHHYDAGTNAQLQQVFSQLAHHNKSTHSNSQHSSSHLPIGDYALSLECVNESEHRKDAVRIIGQSLPHKLSISLDELNSTYTVRGLSRILEKNFSSVSSIAVDLNIASYFHMDTVTELGEAISRSTSVDELSLSYASTDLLTTFLSKVTNNYKANILSLLCDSRVSPTEKLTASTYTDLKTTISSISGVTRFRLNHCKNSLALRNIVRNLPANLLCLELTDCLLDSVSAMDITSYLDRAATLQTLNLSLCELSDGATGMSLFKGLRNNKAILNLNLRGANLSVQAIKVLCEALKFNRNLQTLDLSELELSTQACNSISSLINVNKYIHCLYISNSFISSDGLKVLEETHSDTLKLCIV